MKDEIISDFMEGLRMPVLLNEEQMFIEVEGWGNISGNKTDCFNKTKNCNIGN